MKYCPAVENLRLNSARLAKENYAAGRGNCCPHCQYEEMNSFGLVRWYVPIREQIFVGWADPPWSDLTGNDKAAGFECKKCGALYWFHLSMSQIEDLCKVVSRKKQRRVAKCRVVKRLVQNAKPL